MIEVDFLPPPAAYSVIETGKRSGIVYDRFCGADMLAALMQAPESAEAFSKLLAQLHMDIHKIQVSFFGISSVKSKLREDIQYADGLEAGEKEKISAYLQTLPDGNSMCHFDFHPGNIIMEKDGPVIIDWMTACAGDPCADFARTCLLLNFGEMPSESPQTQAFIKAFQKKILGIYYREYTQCSGIRREDVEKWILPVAAARLRESVADSEKHTLLALIRDKLSTL